MGVEKIKRPVVAGSIANYGSTSSQLSAADSLSVITATATGLVYTLPTPIGGVEFTVVVDYTGATGAVTIANKSTATTFNGSTANVITAASSEVHLNLRFVGISSSRYAVMSSTGSGITLAGSTVS